MRKRWQRRKGIDPRDPRVLWVHAAVVIFVGGWLWRYTSHDPRGSIRWEQIDVYFGLFAMVTIGLGLLRPKVLRRDSSFIRAWRSVGYWIAFFGSFVLMNLLISSNYETDRWIIAVVGSLAVITSGGLVFDRREALARGYDRRSALRAPVTEEAVATNTVVAR